MAETKKKRRSTLREPFQISARSLVIPWAPFPDPREWFPVAEYLASGTGDSSHQYGTRSKRQRIQESEATSEKEREHEVDVSYDQAVGGKEDEYMFGSNESSDEESDSSSESSDTTVSSGGPEICVVCGDGNDAKRLMQCSLCAGWIHLLCYNSRFGLSLKRVPKRDIVCTSKEQCEAGFQRLEQQGLVEQDLPEGSDEALLRDQWNDVEELLSKSSVYSTGSVHSSSLEHFVDRLMVMNRSDPIKYVSLQMWRGNAQGLTKAHYAMLINAMACVIRGNGHEFPSDVEALLQDQSPPQNVLRSLESLLRPGTFRHVTLSQKLGGVHQDVEARFTLHYLDIVDAAFDLHCSNVLKSAGPVRHWTQLDYFTCGRTPNVGEQIRKFAAEHGFDEKDPTEIVIPLILYEDDSWTKSGNVALCPLWLTSALIDPACRISRRDDAHVLLCLLPVNSSIEFAYREGASNEGTARPPGITKQKLELLAKDLRLQAVERIMADIAENQQNGRKYRLSGKIVTVRLILFAFSTDMKERRLLLRLARNRYDCSHCYAHPGVPNDQERFRGNRSLAEDERIRKMFRQGDSAVAGEGQRKRKTINERFKNECGKLGLPLVDDCPLTRVPAKRIHMLKGPYEKFPPELLHMKDGIVIKFMELLENFLGATFLAVTREFGNEFLNTKRFAMHVMEKGIESYHFIPLALQFGEFDSSISQADRNLLVSGACGLLAILGLVNDPAPMLVLKPLRLAIADFHKCVAFLVDKNSEGRNVTPKMHELVFHLIGEIKRLGSLRNVGGKLFETLHQVVIGEYQAGSRRITNGYANREILAKFYYRRCLRDVELLLGDWKPIVEPSAPFDPLPRFHVAYSTTNGSAVRALRDNFALVLHKVFGIGDAKIEFAIPSDLDRAGFRWGNAVELFLECRLRKVKLSRVERAVLPGTSGGAFTSGNAFNCIAYSADRHDCAVGKGDAATKLDCSCFVHRQSLQLFCSSERTDSSFLIPLLFAQDHIFGHPLVVLPDFRATFPLNNALMELECDFKELVKIPFKRVRGIRMARAHHDRAAYRNHVFVYLFQDVFGYGGL